MKLSNLALCTEGVQRVYRNVLVDHIRVRLKAAFGAEAESKLRDPFKRDWDATKKKALDARSKGHIDSPLRDDFDVLSVNHFPPLFERYPKQLLGDRSDRADAMLQWMREIKDLRNPMSHPAEADVTYEDAFRVLDSARRVVRFLDNAAAEKELKAIAKSLAHTPGGADSERAGAIGVASPVSRAGATRIATARLAWALAPFWLLGFASVGALVITRGPYATVPSASPPVGEPAPPTPSASQDIGIADVPRPASGLPACFRPAIFADIDGSMDCITPGDLNGDGKTDLVLLSRASNVARVLLANGDGTFRSAGDYNSHGKTPRAAATADFDGDDRVDLAIANWSTHNVLLMLGTGSGTFRFPISHPAGGSPVAMTDGDFNGDGNRDLAFVDAAVGILLGNGRGGFLDPAHVAAGANPNSLATGDLDGDHHLDLVVANTTSKDVSVLLGRGNGLFKTAVPYDTGLSPVSVTAADLSGDGKVDVAVAGGAGSSTVAILAGNGKGGLGSPVTYAVGTTPVSVVAGDFNGDHRTDLAVANRGSMNVSVLQQGEDGVLEPALTFELRRPPLALVAGDFDGDGRTDLASLNSTTVKNLSVLLQCP